MYVCILREVPVFTLGFTFSRWCTGFFCHDSALLITWHHLTFSQSNISFHKKTLRLLLVSASCERCSVTHPLSMCECLRVCMWTHVNMCKYSASARKLDSTSPCLHLANSNTLFLVRKSTTSLRFNGSVMWRQTETGAGGNFHASLSLRERLLAFRRQKTQLDKHHTARLDIYTCTVLFSFVREFKYTRLI